MKAYNWILLSLLLFISGNIFAEEVEIGDYKYELHDDFTATITGPVAKSISGHLVFPSVIQFNNDNYVVTALGKFAFRDNVEIRVIEIPETVTLIEKCCFENCKGINELYIPGNVVTIERSAFGGLKYLYSLEIQEGVKQLGENCFSGNSIETLVIPKSIVEMGKRCFFACSKLKNVSILCDDLFEIPEYCFGASGLDSVYADSYIPHYRVGAFSSTKLKSFTQNSTLKPQIHNAFESAPIHRGRLFVPAGSEEAYREAEGWGKWWKILPIEEDPNSIDKLEFSADAPTEVYGINGTRLNNTQRGINIIRDKEGKTIKVVK